jgi:hypothetical protein
MPDLSKLYIVIGAKTDSLKTELQGVNKEIGKAERDWKKSFGNIEKSIASMGTKMAVVGATISAAIGMTVKSYADAGSAIYDLSQKTGIGAETISKLKYAAEQTGSSVEALGTASKILSGVIFDASLGMKSQQDRLKALNLDYKNLINLKPEEQFMTVANSIADLTNETEKAALAQDMFGRSGTDLLPMLADGSQGLKEFADRAEELGVVFTDEAAAKADKLGDSLTDLQKSFEGLRNEIGAVLGDALQPYIEDLTNTTTKVREFTTEQRGLSKLFAALTIDAGVTLTSLGGLALMLPKLTSLFRTLGTTLGKGLGLTALGTLGAGLIIYGVTQKAQLDNLSKDIEKVQKQLSETHDIKSAKELVELIRQYNDIVTSGPLTSSEKARVERNAQTADELERQVTAIEEATAAYEKQKDFQINLANEVYTKNIENIEKIYGAYEAADTSKQALEKNRVQSLKDGIDDGTDAYKASMLTWIEATENAINQTKELLNEQYETAKENIDKLIASENDSYQKKKDNLDNWYSVSRDAIEKELDNTRSAHDTKISLLEAEYDAKLKVINAESEAALSGLQAQLDAIDKGEKDKERTARIAELQEAIRTAKTAKDKQKAQDALNAYLHQIDVEDKKAAIRGEMQAVRDKATADKESAKTALDEATEVENTDYELQKKNIESQYALLEQNYKDQKALLDIAHEEEITRLNTELEILENNLAQKEKDLDESLEKAKTRYEEELDAFNASQDIKKAALDTELETNLVRIETEKQAFLAAEKEKLEAKLATINATPTTTGDYTVVTIPSSNSGISGATVVPGYASGGIVERPQLAMVGESGPKAIIPLDKLNELNASFVIENKIYLDSEQITNSISRRQDRQFRTR